MPFGDGSEIAGYTIQRMLGSGEKGEVYLAQHPRLPRQDALRVFEEDLSGDRDFVERFTREMELAAGVGHPHIVGLHGRGTHEGRLWMSMDFVDGTDCGRLLQERYPDGMPSSDALEIIRTVAEALDFAHARGLFHRAVKPANILLADADGGGRRILLGDFGVTPPSANDSGSGAAASRARLGVVTYAAPEQLISLVVDGRTDQYALAVTAYHLLTGAPPFQHEQPAVVIGLHLNAKPPRLADIRPELAAFDAPLARAMSKDPEQRFATCADFVYALEHAAKEVPAAGD
jgi:serine/threonine protein kinase